MSHQTLLETLPADHLNQDWTDYYVENPVAHIRDAAHALRVSEAELVAAACGKSTTRLSNNWMELLLDLETLGPVITRTDNDYAILEKIGVYRNISISRNLGIVLDKALDLRLFFNHWHHGFAVQEKTATGTRHSLQFFDISGTAVHKVYLTNDSDRFAYHSLVGAYQAPNQSTRQWIASLPHPITGRSHEKTKNFFTRWHNLRDTQCLHDLLRISVLSQSHTLEGAVIASTRPFDPSLFPLLMESVADQALNVTFLIANSGSVQIHTGPMFNVISSDHRFSVLHEDFNLQLFEDAIAGAWVVEEETDYGKLTSVELHDRQGAVVALVACQHNPEQPEHDTWRRIVNALPETLW